MQQDRHMSTADLAGQTPRERTTDPVVPREAVPASAAVPAPPPAGEARVVEAAADRPARLFADEESTRFRERWMDVQTGFVDEPRRAVEHADGLVAEVMQRLARIFADERAGLEGQWDRGDQVSTEDLRVAMQRYRAFFDRLLSL